MNINFLVEHIGASQMGFYLLSCVQRICEQERHSPIIFYNQLHRPCRKVMVPALLMVEAWAQPGVSIATSMSIANSLLEWPGPQKKMFYVWDMSWLRNPKVYGPATQLFSNPGLGIIARCEDHARIIENNFNVEVKHVCENFNTSQLVRVIDYGHES